MSELNHINEFAMGQIVADFVYSRGTTKTPTLTIIDFVKDRKDLTERDLEIMGHGQPRWYGILQNAFDRQMDRYEGIVRIPVGFVVSEAYIKQQKTKQEVIKMQGTFQFPEGHNRQTINALALKAGVPREEIGDIVTECFEDSSITTTEHIMELVNEYLR